MYYARVVMKLIQYFLCATSGCLKMYFTVRKNYDEIDSILFMYNVRMRKNVFYRDWNKRQTKLTIDNNSLIGSIFQH